MVLFNQSSPDGHLICILILVKTNNHAINAFELVGVYPQDKFLEAVLLGQRTYEVVILTDISKFAFHSLQVPVGHECACFPHPRSRSS